MTRRLQFESVSRYPYIFCQPLCSGAINMAKGPLFTKISASEDADRLELYNQGLTDAEIGRRLGLTGRAITHWRRSRNLKSHRQAIVLTAKQAKDVMRLYLQGMNDYKIASQLGVPRHIVLKFRVNNDLKANNQPDNHQREQLWLKGYPDSEIARIQGTTKASIQQWRKSRNLKRHKEVYQLTCPDCGKSFITGHHKVRRCPECQAVQNSLNYEQSLIMWELQSTFKNLCIANPSKARDYYEDMWRAEGQDFTRAILGKIYDQFCA